MASSNIMENDWQYMPGPAPRMVDTPANLAMAFDPDGCKQLKDIVNRQDATTMVVVLARSDEQHSSANKKEESSKARMMDSRLLMALRTGDNDNLRKLVAVTDGRPHVVLQMGEDSGSSDVGGSSTTQAEAERPSDPSVANSSSNAAASALLLNGVTFDSQGDSALHVVAASGDTENYLDCAKMVFDRAKHLLEATNKKGDTPLHCAARAGNRAMVTCLIEMADQHNKFELLRKENKAKGTALHSAIRSRDTKLTKMLMWEDPELACFPNDGTSPLYLAISSGLPLQCLGHLFKGRSVSLSGPHGQNILHISVWLDVFRGKAVKEVFRRCPVLKEKELTEQGDKDGNTPLHFAASMDMWEMSLLSALFLNVVGQYIVYPFWFLRCCMSKEGPTMVLIEGSKSPGSAVFKPDNEGSYPIHVAAASGCIKAAIVMLERFPSCATLPDGRGRTFLHVAANKNKWVIVGYASGSPKFESALNMQDNDGNTALHLAIESGNEWTFRYLFQNPKVRLDLPNEDGLTALELAWRKIPARGRFYHLLNPRSFIFRALRIARAAGVISRKDQLEDKYHTNEIDEDRLSDNITKGSQVMGILAGLVTSITFAAAFKLPGGYRPPGDDADGNNGETPWLAGRYAFDAFIISIALSFICSLLATIGLIYSGFNLMDFKVRISYFHRSYRLLQSSARSLAVAFGLGIYLVMLPVAPKIATAVCVIIFGGLVFQNFEIWKSIILTNTIRIRHGLWAALRLPTLVHWEPVVPLPLALVVQKFWSLIVIFLLPAPWISLLKHRTFISVEIIILVPLVYFAFLIK